MHEQSLSALTSHMRVHGFVMDSPEVIGGDSQLNFCCWAALRAGTLDSLLRESGPASSLAYLFSPPLVECSGLESNWTQSPGQDHILGCQCPWPCSSLCNCILLPNPPPAQLDCKFFFISCLLMLASLWACRDWGWWAIPTCLLLALGNLGG